MNTLINFLNKDISLKKQQYRKKLPLKKQIDLLTVFHNLWISGFSLNEIVYFLRKSQLIDEGSIIILEKTLVDGKGLSEMMRRLGFSEKIVTQISLSESHGNIENCLEKLQLYLKQILSVKHKLIEVITYPIILMSFLVVIILGLKNYLFPQLDQKSTVTQVLINTPYFFSILGLLCVIILIIFALWLRYENPLKVLNHLSKIPLLSSFIRLYFTAYFACEWGTLFSQGLELMTIIRIMREQPSKLFRNVGIIIEKGLMEGKLFYEIIPQFSFFQPELSLIVECGDYKSKLGDELTVYGNEIWKKFFRQINQSMQFIQPLVFMIVALMIVMIYAAMLLPMYQNMEVTF